MAEIKKHTAAKPISDVAHPNATAPSPNSKSVIVGHGAMAADPMVVPDDKAKPMSTGGSAKAKIEPLTTSPKPEPAPKLELPIQSEVEEPTSASAPVVESLAAPKAPIDEADVKAEQQAQRKAAIEKLVESKKYFLPINSIEKRRSKRFVAAGMLLGLILLIAWADIALDANLLNTSINLPHTHFFS